MSALKPISRTLREDSDDGRNPRRRSRVRPSLREASGPATAFEPIEYVSVADRVYRVIKDRILTQQIPLGGRLRDETLATQLGTSRTPVREAVMQLIREGLVEAVPRSHTAVRMFTEDDLERIYDLRIALEMLAARRAAERLTAEQVRWVAAHHRRAEAALKKGDPNPALAFDRELHALILEASGNVYLQRIMTTINDYVTLFRNIGATTPTHKGFNFRHREIVRALQRHDGEEAARAVAEHIVVAREQTLRDFRERRLLRSTSVDQSASQPGRGARTVNAS